MGANRIGTRIALIPAALIFAMLSISAFAGGWKTVHKYVHRTGNCPAGAQEVLSSRYWSGRRTATGEKFYPREISTASNYWPLGSTLHISNPHNGRRLSIRVNDRGPFGEAARQGAKLDLSLGAANFLGMRQATYLCVTVIGWP